MRIFAVRDWAALLTLCALGACGSEPAQPTPAPLVWTVVAAPSPGATVSFTGTIRARSESDLAFRLPGKVVARLVEPGEPVRRGQRLASLDASDYALAASAASDQAAAARAENQNAQQDLRRLLPLAQHGFVTGRSLDLARADAAAAAARAGAAEAVARSAGNQAGYTALVADADGVVMAIMAEPGQVVAAGSPVARLARGPRDAVVDIPESHRPIANRPAHVSVYAEPRRFIARLHSLASAADPATRTYQARFGVAGGEGLPLGATATVTILQPEAAQITVPLGALHDAGKEPGVWVVGADNRVRFRQVRIGTLSEESASIVSGLRAGERVVALGAHLLRPGQRVRLGPAWTAR